MYICNELQKPDTRNAGGGCLLKTTIRSVIHKE